MFFRYLRWYGELSGAAMMQAMTKDTKASPEALSFGGGVIGWLSFAISPATLLASYFVIEGVARALSGSMAAEPLPSLPFWLLGKAHDEVDRLLARRRLAPPAPDIVEFGQPGETWDLRITCVRPKPDWHALVQVEYIGKFYSVATSGQEMVEGQLRFCHYLKTASELAGFRGIVHYDPFEYWKQEEK